MASRRTDASKRRRAVAAFEKQKSVSDSKSAPQPTPSVTPAPRSGSGASRRRTERRASSSSSSMILSIVSVVVIVIGGIIALQYIPASEEEPVKAAPKKAALDISWRHPRVQKVVSWVGYAAAGDDFQLRLMTDLDQLQTNLGIEPDRPLAAQNTGGRQEVERILLDELRKGDSTAIFRHFEPGSGQLDEESMHDANRGTVTLEMPPRDGSPLAVALADKKTQRRYTSSPEARVRFSFEIQNKQLIVTGWSVLYEPKVPQPKKKKGHTEIAAPKAVEKEWQGKKIVVQETEIVPLSHLEDTPEELRQEIDGLVETLMDLEGSGAVANRAIYRLRDIGRPAVPRLLTKMYEIQPKETDDRLRLRRVIQALREMTGVAFGFNVAEIAHGGVSEEERQSSLRQWYAWWYRNHNKDFTRSIDKAEDESLFLTEEEKKAQRAEAKK